MPAAATARRCPSLAALVAAIWAVASLAGCERLPVEVGDRPDAGPHLPAVDGGDEVPTFFVRDIALGSDFACALLTDGAVACWGSDSHGQLGLDPTVSIGTHCGGVFCQPTPQRNVRLGRVDTLGAGDAFVCARSTHGTAACMGSNRFGELGGSRHPDGERHLEPIEVFGYGMTLELAVGRHHACAIGPDRRVRCWGLAEHGQLGRAVTERCPVPEGMHAELGVPATTSDVACSSTPAEVEGLEDPVDHVVAGDFHTCALAAGKVTCWGRNDRGQLGIGAAGAARATPSAVAVAGGPLTGVRALALGGGTAIALQTAGTSARWGDATQGALAFAPDEAEPCGDGRCAPTPRVEPWYLTEVALGRGFGCGLDTTGRVHCWGLAQDGRLGITGVPRTRCATEDGEAPCALEPLVVPDLGEGVRAIAVGDAHACALVYVGAGEDGSVRCWGRNDRGQLGRGVHGGVGEVPVAIRGTR